MVAEYLRVLTVIPFILCDTTMSAISTTNGLQKFNTEILKLLETFIDASEQPVYGMITGDNEQAGVD